MSRSKYGTLNTMVQEGHAEHNFYGDGLQIKNIDPSGHTTLKQRRVNLTQRRDVESTLT